jgi:hypothetical protein
MKDNRCFVCKYNQDHVKKYTDDYIYDSKGKPVTLPLCYGHSIEFFKIGQISFVVKHRHIFAGAFGSETDLELVNYFKRAPERSWY